MTELQTKTKGRKRVIIAAGALLGVAALATSAAFLDFANLNLGANGIGNDNGPGTGGPDLAFNIQVAQFDADGLPKTAPAPENYLWTEANTVNGDTVPIPGADILTPGGAVTTVLPYRNWSNNFKAAVTFDIKDYLPTNKPANTLPTSDSAEDGLLYTVTQIKEDSSEVVLATKLKMSELTTWQLGTLDLHEQGKISVKIEMVDNGSPEANEVLKDLVAHPQAQFKAVSVAP